MINSKLVILLSLLAISGCSAQFNYDSGQSQKMWDFTQIAYCDPSAISAWDCTGCASYTSFGSIILAQADSLLGFVGYDSSENVIYVSFRGTDNIENWYNNIDTVQTSYPSCSGCEVHAGFYAAYNDVSSQIIAAIQNLQSTYPNNGGIKVTGHSLGGAMCTHAVLDITQQGIGQILSVSTFGSPRVGNQAFATYYNSQVSGLTSRLTHYRDPVPHVPTLSMGFYHIDTEVYYDNAWDTYTICTGESDSCSDQFLTDLDLSDHHTYFGGVPSDYCTATSQYQQQIKFLSH